MSATARPERGRTRPGQAGTRAAGGAGVLTCATHGPYIANAGGAVGRVVVDAEQVKEHEVPRRERTAHRRRQPRREAAPLRERLVGRGHVRSRRGRPPCQAQQHVRRHRLQQHMHRALLHPRPPHTRPTYVVSTAHAAASPRPAQRRCLRTVADAGTPLPASTCRKSQYSSPSVGRPAPLCSRHCRSSPHQLHGASSFNAARARRSTHRALLLTRDTARAPPRPARSATPPRVDSLSGEPTRTPVHEPRLNARGAREGRGTREAGRGAYREEALRRR